MQRALRLFLCILAALSFNEKKLGRTDVKQEFRFFILETEPIFIP